MEVKLGNDFFYIKTPYVDRHFVARGLNGIWSKKENMYRFPKNIHAMREVIRSYPQLKNHYGFVAEGMKLQQVQKTFLELKSLEDSAGDSRLRPYQRTDINYLKQLPSAGIFNEPRTGKTPTSIMLMKEKQFTSILVICPASLIWNWKKEFEKWYPELMPYVVTGTPKKREIIYKRFEGQVYGTPTALIISKDTWKKEQIDYKFDACFVDEAHFLRNYDSAQSKSVFAVKADHRYALTGTPTVKHSVDIYGILHFLYKDKFPSYWQFVDRYYDVYDGTFGREIRDVKSGRKQELQELIGFISVQRKRSEVMKWLPEKQKITHYTPLEGKQIKLYQDMLDDMYIQEDDVVIDTPSVLAQLMRLRQLVLDPRLIGLDVVGVKTKALLEWLDNNREPVVIMSNFTSYFSLVKKDIEKLGLKVGELHGKMSNAEKNQAAEDFQNGKVDVLLCNVITAATGFTLDRAKVMLFLDKPWSPSEVEQCEDRITPVSKERNHAHEIISFVVPNSVDEHINNILDKKLSLTDIINNGGRNAIYQLLGR